MIIKKTKFKDLLIVKQKNNSDKRGSLRETFNDKILKKKFIFEYCTTSKKNVFRGFHFQTKNKQSKFVNVVKGKAFSNVREANKEATTVLKASREITLESALEYIQDDELVEITPDNIRIRKTELSESKRKQIARKNK